MSKKWTGGNDKSYLESEIIDDILKYAPEKIFIGCDSQPIKNKIVFVKAICVVREDKGARFWTQRITVPKKNFTVLSVRLIEEVNLACNTAIQLRESLPYEIVVHADISPHEKNRSNKVAQQAIAYIKALQFEYAIKPDSWASCSVADRKTK